MQISNGAEYQAALNRAWALLDAPEGSTEETELLALCDAIEAYEEGPDDD